MVALWDTEQMHCGICELGQLWCWAPYYGCIVGYETDALWDLWIRSITVGLITMMQQTRGNNMETFTHK